MAAVRKKACEPCATAKVRCSRQPGRLHCDRCEKRFLTKECNLDKPSFTGSEQDGGLHRGDLFHVSDVSANESTRLMTPASWLDQSVEIPGSTESPNRRSVTTMSSSIGLPLGSTLSFINLELVCLVEPAEIRNRWLKPWATTDMQNVKNYPLHIINLMSSVFSAYSLDPGKHGSMPPFVHKLQYTCDRVSQSLSACRTIWKIYNQSGPSLIPSRYLEDELDRITAHYKTFDEFEMLAAFQAYLIYVLLVNFRLKDQIRKLPLMMATLQEIAAEVATKGLTCKAELHRTRPSWECWIIAESKRRTMYTMYMLDSVLCYRDGLPSFRATELRGTLAPATKVLWDAVDREIWSLAYNEHVYIWGAQGYLRIEELWPVESELSPEDVSSTRNRVTQWISGFDDFGMFLYAVSSSTHHTND